jgi:uroporphyrinogen-III decarboxylase
MLEVSFERFMDQLNYLPTNGVGPVYYINGPEYAMPPLMSPCDFEEFVMRYDRAMVSKIHEHGKLAHIHCHGRLERCLERFAAIGTDGLNPLEPPPLGDVDLRDAKRRIGERVCLVGNIQYEDLASSSVEGVEALVKQAISQGAPGGGFILALCAAPYQVPLPPKTARNMIAMLRF